jgi:hypothetical protein
MIRSSNLCGSLLHILLFIHGVVLLNVVVVVVMLLVMALEPVIGKVYEKEGFILIFIFIFIEG